MADIKQYVNLDPAKPDELKELKPERAGRDVMVTAKIDKKLAGVPVIFEIKSGANNINPSLELTNFSPRERGRIASGGGGVSAPNKARRRVVTNADGEAQLTIKLSEFGGDEFEVKAYLSKKKKKFLESNKYIVWRRIYYQVSRFKSGPKGSGRTGSLPEVPKFDWADVKTEFEARRHNIELIDDSSTDLVTRQCNVLDADNDFKKSAKRGYDSKREPVSMRVVLVNQIASPSERAFQFAKVSEGAEAVVKNFSSRLWFDDSMELKKDAIVYLKWRRLGASGWEDMDLKYVDIVNPTKIRINFDKMKIPKKNFFDFFRKVQVKIKVRLLSSSTNGVSWYNTIWIAKENMYSGDRPDDDKRSTTIHETGHFVGMVPNTQTTYYDRHGHQGGHCFQGLSATDQTQAKYWGLSGTCVMFGESARSRLNVFCLDCDPSVRKTNVRIDRMPASW